MAAMNVVYAYGLRCEINCLTVGGSVKNMASFSAPFQLKMSPSLCIYIPSPVQKCHFNVQFHSTNYEAIAMPWDNWIKNVHHLAK